MIELIEEIAALSRVKAYRAIQGAADAETVDVIQTHISVVFLVGDAVFKVKKPLRLPFVDYSTLAARLHFCEAEVELNRRLATDVYRGIVPITQRSDGELVVGAASEDDAPIVDYAVEMRRLDPARTLGERLDRGEVRPGTMTAIGKRIAEFHRLAARGPEIDAHAEFAPVAANCRDNFTQTAELKLDGIPPALLDRLSAAMESELARQAPTIKARAAAGRACDCHGDLRLDHVYLFPERPAPADLEIIDCIEFNDAFRYSDPIADIAFLLMDLRNHGHEEQAEELQDAYIEASGDREGAALLPLYIAYRACVRGKVEAFRASEPEVPSAHRREALDLSLRHLLLALRQLVAPPDSPSLLLIAGLPGSGKSTLAATLASSSAVVIRSDVVRKELVGLSPDTSSAAAPGEGIYTPEMSRRTYAACLAQARAQLLAGRPVIVDANLRKNDQRRSFAQLAATLGVPISMLICEVSEAETLRRIAARRGDASDADADVYHHAKASWEAPAEDLCALRLRTIDANATPAATHQRAKTALRDAGFPLVE